MPRLLLVDDNPSIHKIAETLLAATDVDLVCAGSGAEALALVHQGERFDVALLDTSMLAMDGWALLEQLRDLDATATIPIAMMAGVLDLVDPERLRLAPIQGFLKKPVELRNLGERVQRLLETPVEPRPKPEPPSPFLTTPGFSLADHPELIVRVSDDVLVLGPEDLAPEAPADEFDAELEAAPRSETGPGALDLEELDLDGLQGLTAEPMPPQDVPTVEDLAAIPEFSPEDAFPPSSLEWSGLEPVAEPRPEELPLAESDADLFTMESVVTDELPDLGEERPGQALPAFKAEEDLSLFDWSDDSDMLLRDEPFQTVPESTPEAAYDAALDAAPEAAPVAVLEAEGGKDSEADLDLELISGVMLSGDLAEPAMADLETLETVPTPVPVAEPLPVPRPLPLPVPLPLSGAALADPLAAVLADPVLMDQLARAVVARLGDQALREIAWELMPELADRLHRN
jgi:CheY-like chemotaxis protein